MHFPTTVVGQARQQSWPSSPWVTSLKEELISGVIVQCRIAGYKGRSLKDIDFHDSSASVARIIYRTICTF